MIGSAFLRTSQCERCAKLETSVCRPIWRARAACRVAPMLRPSHDRRVIRRRKPSAPARWALSFSPHFRPHPFRESPRLRPCRAGVAPRRIGATPGPPPESGWLAFVGSRPTH